MTEREPTSLRVLGSFSQISGPRFLLAAMVVFLLLAIAKPWSFGTASGSAPEASRAIGGLGPSVPPATELLAPSPATVADPNGMACDAGAAEQLVTLERRPGNEVRSWIIIADETSASGPLDPTMARVAVYSSHVVGLGVCATKSLGGAGAVDGASILNVWALNPRGSVVSVGSSGTSARITRNETGPGSAVLYGPPILAGDPRPLPAPSDAPGSTDQPVFFGRSPDWPIGSYAISYLFPADPSGQVRWIRVDLMPSAGPQG